MQIANGFLGQQRIDIIHHVDDIPGVIQHDDDQHGEAGDEPESLRHLMRNVGTLAGSVQLCDDGSQRQQ